MLISISELRAHAKAEGFDACGIAPAKLPDEIGKNLQAFIANGNQPLSPEELSDRIGRSGQGNTILRTLSGARVYKGLRPVY